MNYKKTLLLPLLMVFSNIFSFSQMKLTPEIALSLSRLPLHCIDTEFPNKTSHLADGPSDATLLPSELHPVFYGCLDWHSSVHGHWMLVRLLQTYPNMSNKDSIIAVLDNSFQIEKMIKEAAYFGKYTSSKNFERTYGWAWLLKLDQALGNSRDPHFIKWHAALQPLTKRILGLWKEYLPKLTYPNRTGVHPNTAFGLDFAYDWAIFYKDEAFANAIKAKAFEFYGSNKNIPAYLEPDGTDFFSPSLMAASLMSKLMDKKPFTKWLKKYYSKESINRICTMPIVSDRSDYHIVHLDGLSFSRAWCMRTISRHLSDKDPLKKKFNETADLFLEKTLPNIFDNYGGEHWLASFAIYALLES
ncbi:MAG TPA: DUF2891 domain-containing protein [Edaphocola sp.]|nr:DUF2891 domain-containing protein [Edaphocola sp.]